MALARDLPGLGRGVGRRADGDDKISEIELVPQRDSNPRLQSATRFVNDSHQMRNV